MEATLKEAQSGYSLMGGVSGGASALVPIKGIPVNVGGKLALGGGLSVSKGERSITGETVQTLHDSILQNTNAVRTLNTTVIVQATQAERNALQTRTVTNHNHCHALTIEYYEVLRNLRVETMALPRKPRRKVVLIPYKLINFTWEKALKLRPMLERSLLDPSLAACFDAIIRHRKCPALYERDEEKPNPTSINVLVRPPRPDNLETNPGIYVQPGSLIEINAAGQMTWGLIGMGSFGPDGYPAAPIDPSDGQYLIEPGLKVETPFRDMVPASLVCLIAGRHYQGGSQRQFRDDSGGSLTLRVNLPGIPEPTGLWKDFLTGRWNVTVRLTPPKKESDRNSEDRFDEASDKCCEERLLAHLNANLGYYNRAIWMLRDPVEQRLLLDGMLLAWPDLRERIDDSPLAVSGNHVAYLYRDPEDNAGPEEGGDRTPQELPEPQISIVSLPTRGLFAEAILGRCNACEKRDVTRFWKWEESPCERPPQITGITPGPRGQQAQLPAAGTPSATVGITEPPGAPDPLGLKAVMEVLGKPEIFRDQSTAGLVGALLGQLARNADSLAQQAAAGAQAAQKPPAASQPGTASQSPPASSGGGRMTPGERYDNLQVAREVDNLPVDEEQKSAIIRAILADDNAPNILPAGAANAFASDVAVDAAVEISTGLLKELFKVGEASILGFEDGRSLIDGFNRSDFEAGGGPYKRMITVIIDNLGENLGLGDGVTAGCQIVWSEVKLRPEALQKVPVRERRRLGLMTCKADIRTVDERIDNVDNAVAEAKIVLSMVKLHTSSEARAAPAYVRLSVSIKGKKLPGSNTRSRSAEIPLDNDKVRWVYVRDDPETKGIGIWLRGVYGREKKYYYEI